MKCITGGLSAEMPNKNETLLRRTRGFEITLGDIEVTIAASE